MVRNLVILMEILAIVCGMAAFFGKKIKVDIATVSFVIVELFLVVLINDYVYPAYVFSITYVFIVVYALVEYKTTLKRAVWNCLLTIAANAVLQQFFSIILLKIMNSDYALFGALIINVCCVMVLLLFIRNGRLKNFSTFILDNRKIYIAIVLFGLVCLGINIINAKIIFTFQNENYLQVIFFSILLLIIIMEWQKTRRDYEREKARREVSSLYGGAYEELIELVRDKQHDLKNHINALYSMIYTIEDPAELVARQKEYCEKVLDACKETKLLLSVRNPLLAGFFYQKIQGAEAKGITVTCRLEGMPEKCSVSDYEIVEMLGILFDNAVEAVCAGECPVRKIVVEYRREETWEIFSVANTGREYSQKEIEQFFVRGYSSKGRHRGIGLDKIRRKLQELDGGIHVASEMEENAHWLKFSIMLPVNGNNKRS